MRQPKPKIPIPEWSRVPDAVVESLREPRAEPIDEMWQWREDKYAMVIQVHKLGEKCFGESTHLLVKKVDTSALLGKDKIKALYDSREPNYNEKFKIVQKLCGQNGTIAMEVFPRQKNVVDLANLYHIWTAQKGKFPFGVREATELPKGKEWESEQVVDLDIEYMVRTVRTELGKVAYLYLRRKDGQELCWREKQFLKNELQGEDLTAIELISKHGLDKPTCLLFLPLGYCLDFGLHIL